MSVEITMIEFEKREAHLSSELDDGAPYTVHGIALGEGDTTRGASGIKKYWPAEELEKAAKTLEGRNLVEDHNNDSRGVVGKVTKAGYKPGAGVLYEAELFDEELAQNIHNGLLEVSIRGYHNDVDEMEEDEEGAKIVEGIQFDNLSIVPSGASPSNTLEMGPAAELSTAELSEHVSALQEESDDDGDSIEAGDYVQWGDSYGIVLTMPEDGNVEVDLYEESDGVWRSIGETEMVSTGDLSSWDVEDDDIGAAEEESSEDEESSDEEEEAADPSEYGDDDVRGMTVPDEHMFDDRRAAVEKSKQLGLNAAHKMDDMWVPGKTHEEYLDAVSEQSKHKMDEETDDDTESEMAPAEDFLFDTEEDAQSFIEDEDGLTGVHEMDDGWMPGVDHAEFEEWHEAQHSEEASEGDGAEKEYRSDIDRRNGSGEERNPDGAFDGEYTHEETGEESRGEAETAEAASADEGSIESDVEELQEWAFHEVSWDGTTEGDWSRPDMEDFDTDDLSSVASHFLLSQTGFPPENFTDLALPVVTPSGDLSISALRAVKGGRGASAVDGLSTDMEEEIVEYVNNLANEYFDKEWSIEEASVTGRNAPTEPAKPTHKMDPDVEDDEESEMMDPIGSSLDLINIFLRANGKNERDSLDKMLSWMFSSTDIPSMKMEAFRTAANSFLDAQGGADSFDAVDVDSFRDWLLTQGGQTDDGRHARSPGSPTAGSGLPRIATPVHVLSGDDLRSHGASEKGSLTKKVFTTMTNIEEELEDLDEPVAVEKSDLEELQGKADRMDEMSETLTDLKERTDVLDSVDSEKVEELAEGEDPIVVESDEYEALSDEAEQVKSLYAEALSEDSPFEAEDFVDKFSIEELREKYEAAGGDLEEELSAEPKSGDPSEEELEERAGEENKSEEELAEEEEIESEQERLRGMITGSN